MANRRKPKPQQKPAPSSAVTPAPPENSPIAKNHIRRIAERLFDSAVDTALESFWVGVAMVVLAIIVTLSLYLRGGGAPWVYPYLNFALGFTCACLFFITASSLLLYVKAKRRKALERAKNPKFVSPKKGLLDHLVNKKAAEIELNNLLLAVAKEIGEVGKTANKATSGFNLASGDLAKGHKVASDTAARLNKHAEKMERYMVKIQSATDLLIDSNTGSLQWNLTKGDPSREALINARQTYVGEIELIKEAVNAIKSYAISQNSLRDLEMLQEINTSMNRLDGVTNDIIAVIQKVENSSYELIAMIDEKLASSQS